VSGDAAALASCAELTSFTVAAGGKVTGATVVPAGKFAPTSGRGGPAAYAGLAPFCRVTLTLTPSPDSDIKAEVWLPLEGWTGRYQAVGNGGWAGSVSYPAMARALARGEVASSTDTGHVGNSGAFALGHPEKLIDYAYRAQHETAVAAKAVAESFYGTAPRWSYFNGCSTGGRQALRAAERFPADFDGIVAGAPANPKTNMDVARITISQTMFRDAASVVPASKYPVIHQAVLAACDALDGLKDGLLGDPTACRFDPAVLQCQGEDSPSCLTRPQVESVRAMMTPVTDRQSGSVIFPRYEPGSELGWGSVFGGPEPYATAQDTFKFVVFKDPNWSWRTLSAERDLVVANREAAGTLTAVNPDLAAFAGHGGKLLMYHGWADPNIAPRASVTFYQAAIQATRAPASNTDWARLFMVPGMAHCTGGEGPNTFDAIGAVETWVENGQAPASLVASHQSDGKVDRTRPLCPYPQVAGYRGTGSIDAAENFACVAP